MERNLAMFRKKTPQDVQFARAAEHQRCRLASVCDMCVEQLSEHVHKQAMLTFPGGSARYSKVKSTKYLFLTN